MNEDLAIFWGIRILLLVLLFVVPFLYCVTNGNFKKGFWFTWIVWSVVVFLFGISLPYWAEIRERATGEPTDIMCGGFVLGILTGWLPGLMFAYVGKFLHNILVKLFLKNN